MEKLGNIVDIYFESNDSFFVIITDKIKNQIAIWEKYFPNIKPYYAVKCNPNIDILKILNESSVNFDCASKKEIEIILKITGDPKRIIYANPIKRVDHIKYAADNNVDLLTFDSISELEKINKHHPNAKLVIRIKADETGSRIKFNNKFGISNEEINEVIYKCKNLSANLVGLSFHVGSGACSKNQYTNTLTTCSKILDIATKYNYKLNIIDIGGGFPILRDDFEEFKFLTIASSVNSKIKELFDDKITVIAEPGRFIVGNSHLLFIKIIGKKVIGEKFTYYINDSIYGSFNNIIYDNENITINVVKDIMIEENLYDSTIYGQTCDSIDVITKSIKLPELFIGDWLYVNNMGAYTIAASSTFNGFELAKIIVI